jgi:hypothetical protein
MNRRLFTKLLFGAASMATALPKFVANLSLFNHSDEGTYSFDKWYVEQCLKSFRTHIRYKPFDDGTHMRIGDTIRVPRPMRFNG